MYCKNCGNKLNDNDKFCFNCGTQTEFIESEKNINNQELLNINKKDKLLNTSTISFIIFMTIVLANVIVYPLSLSDNLETTGMSWFFFVLLPSIPLFEASLILTIISIVNFIKDKKKNIPISKFRNAFIILNIIQLIIMCLIVVGIIILFSM